MATDSAQAADAVLMVRPASFGWNAQTAASNRFQPPVPVEVRDAGARAVAEFDALAGALADAGVTVHAFDDRAQPACPDAVFPNNWVSLHADGTVVLYPMLAPNRRRERRLELVAALEHGERGVGHRVERLLDLTHHELRGRCLEGTGSVVFDHPGRLAYACLSPRTDARVLDELCEELGYEPVTFEATVCAESVVPEQRGALLERLASAGRRVVTIDRREMADFAGNVLELRAADGARVLAASRRALASLSDHARATLTACVERVVAVPVPTIEDLGGGSVRCMLAEVFLPR